MWNPLSKPAALGLALLALLASGCARDAPPAARNAVLISIDTLRADHLGAYGHDRETSPNLDAFAARGVLFEDVTSTAPWTLPAHASMLTGLYPVNHGVRTNLQRLPEDVPTLAGTLSAQGFRTGAFVNAFFMKPKFGLGRDFDSYQVFREDQTRTGATGRVLQAASDWIHRHGEDRFLLLVHLFDVHSSYHSLPRYERLFVHGDGRYSGDTIEIMLGLRGDVPLEPDDAARLARLYDAGIRQLDAQINGFLATLDTTETLVVITSDHGEEFLEHGGMVHGHSHYDEVLRVPWIMVGPGVPPDTRIDVPVSLVDLMPTVLDLLEVGGPQADGTSLRPLWSGDGDPDADGRGLIAETGPMEEDTLRSLRRGRFKLIEDRESGTRRLYDLSEDPREQRDLTAAQPDLAAALAEELARRTASPRAPESIGSFTEKMKERLRQLGYLEP